MHLRLIDGRRYSHYFILWCWYNDQCYYPNFFVKGYFNQWKLLSKVKRYRLDVFLLTSREEPRVNECTSRKKEFSVLVVLSHPIPVTSFSVLHITFVWWQQRLSHLKWAKTNSIRKFHLAWKSCTTKREIPPPPSYIATLNRTIERQRINRMEFTHYAWTKQLNNKILNKHHRKRRC